MNQENIYCKSVTRFCSLTDVKAWYLGESKELEKWIGFGFFSHIFMSESGKVTLYYNFEEGEKFHEIFKKKFTDEIFNKLCDYFFELIEKSRDITSDEEIFNIMVRIWPALTIFDEISKYPELANELIIRRLIKIRRATEQFSYELSKRMHHEDSPELFIFHKGNLIIKPLEEFIKENEFIIK